MATFKYNTSGRTLDAVTTEVIGTETADINKVTDTLSSFETLNFPETLFSDKNFNNTDRVTHVMSFFLYAPFSASMQSDPNMLDEFQTDLVVKALGSDYLKQVADNASGIQNGLGVAESAVGAVTKGERLMIKRSAKAIKTVINLFMPDTINNDLNMQYNTMELFNKNGLFAKGASIADLWETMAGKTEASKTSAVTSFVEAFTNPDSEIGRVAAATMGGLGVVINPQAEVLFQTVDFRRFQYDFILTPKSNAESVQVKKIINLFRKYAVPQFIGKTTGRMMLTPGYFEIKYLTMMNGVLQENPWVIKTSTCALTNVNVDYAPNGWSTHEDGSPISYRLNLQFQELELLHRDRIDAGY